jgi:chemotaxis family two-component system sensor kinase Cph1
MSEPLDLETLIAACANEPIQAPGAVQSHGALLVVDPTERVVAVSANTFTILGIDPVGLLDQRVVDLLGSEFAAAVASDATGEVVIVDGLLGPLELVVRRAGDLRLVETEPAPAVAVDINVRISQALRDFYGATSADQLTNQAVRTVQTLTGFDRVMAYRFDRDWNGEVIAEVVEPGHGNLIGLRFPASDIPPQARALYSRARIRLIPDATSPPSLLLAVDRDLVAGLDLSDASLRAVSPVHLQYLHNMGVTASMSVAVHVGDRLWGLIACHHLTGPLRPSLHVREAVELVGRATSTLLAAFLEAESASARVALLERVDDLSEALLADHDQDPVEVLAELSSALPMLLDATGAAVVDRGRVRSIGRCPPDDVIASLLHHARSSESWELQIEELSSIDPVWIPYAAVAAGAVVVPIDASANRWLLWFRGETREVVRWGGDPTAREIATAADGRSLLNPRSSFREYLQQVEGRSVPWTQEQVGAARTLAHRLAELYSIRTRRNAEVAALIQRTILLEEFPLIPGLEGAARYLPSSGHPIGGDWYDVFFRSVAGPILALGDVAGHGVEAAATMAQLRHALRAYVLREESLAEAMSRLNELMLSLLPKEMATALLMGLDPATRSVEIVNAGHFSPVLVGPEGARFVEGDRNLVLGVRGDTQYGSTRIDLPPGSTLIAYTDGLVERRDMSIDACLAGLLEALPSLAETSVEEICDRLLGLSADVDGRNDDVTVVALRFTGGVPRVESTYRAR